MKVMGIDASTSCTGYSVFEDGKLVAYGAIYPDHKTGIKWRGKLIEIGAKFKDLLSTSKLQNFGNSLQLMLTP